jgi:hypothetical protein
MTIMDLVLEYSVGPDSVSQRAKDIVDKSFLDREDVLDRGDCNGSSHVGRLGVEPSLFVRVIETVIEMQALLT